MLACLMLTTQARRQPRTELHTLAAVLLFTELLNVVAFADHDVIIWAV